MNAVFFDKKIILTKSSEKSFSSKKGALNEKET